MLRPDEVRKPVLVKASLHRQLKRICFNHDVKLQDLADAIIESVLNEEKKLASTIEKLKK
jgi:hypothetical protein